MTIQQIIDRMKQSGEATPQFRPGLIHLEKRGTEKIGVIRALAYAYSVPFEEAERAARNSRRVFQN